MKNIILVVGESPEAQAIEAAATYASVKVAYLLDTEAAWTTLEAEDCIMAFWELELLSADRLEAYKSTMSRSGRTEIVAIGTDPDANSTIRAFRAGARDVLARPVAKERVSTVLSACPMFRRRSGSTLATRIDEFVEGAFADPELTMSLVAQRFRITTGYVGRLYREDVGMTFRSRVHELRVDRARELLLTTEKTMSEIAYTCGFRQPGRFSEAFSSEFGVPPREFRYLNT